VKTASFEAAQVFRKLSGILNIFQVLRAFMIVLQRGKLMLAWGYWRIRTDYITPKSRLKKFILSVLKTLVRFISILTLMRLMDQTLDMDLSLKITSVIYMRQSIPSLKIAAVRLHLRVL
jgi:hypothetical protein